MTAVVYDDLLISVGSFGPYQRRLFVMLVLATVPGALHILNIVFHNMEPNYRCAVPGLDNDTYAIQSEYHQKLVNASIPWDDTKGRYSGKETYKHVARPGFGSQENQMHSQFNDTVRCDKWVYSRSVLTTSFVADFDLVEDRKIYKNHLNMVTMLGFLIGSLMVGPLSDLTGRRNSLVFAIIPQTVCAIAIAFVQSYLAVLALRCILAASFLLVYFNSFVFLTELVGPNRRVLVGQGVALSWCAGGLIIVIINYSIRTWRTAQLVVAIPPLIFVSYFWLMPESPRWLLVKGRSEKALQVFKTIAKANKVRLTENISLMCPLDETQLEHPNGAKAAPVTLRHIFSNRVILVRLVVLAFGWATLSQVYFGLTMNIGALVEGNIYMNFALHVFIETAGDTVCLVFMEKVGRKLLYCGSFLLCGGALLAMMVPILIRTEAKWVSIVMSCFAKFGISVAFSTAFIITAELLPTVIRTSGLGFCSFVSRIGGIVSPYIATLGMTVPGSFGRVLPFIIFGGSAVTVGLTSLIFPETRKRKLPETLEDLLDYDRSNVSKKHEIKGHDNIADMC